MNRFLISTACVAPLFRSLLLVSLLLPNFLQAADLHHYSGKEIKKLGQRIVNHEGQILNFSDARITLNGYIELFKIVKRYNKQFDLKIFVSKDIVMNGLTVQYFHFLNDKIYVYSFTPDAGSEIECFLEITFDDIVQDKTVIKERNNAKISPVKSSVKKILKIMQNS